MEQSLKKPTQNTSPALLLADDEEPIRQVLRAQLTSRGYFVYEACTGEEVLRAVPVQRPDVILLDIGLPDIDGIEVTQRLRRCIQIPIIILSVRSAHCDKIAALEAGADDYLTKPCQTGELIEHIHTALLRRTVEEARTFRVGDLVIDLDGRVVQIGNRNIQLTGIEFELLKTFVLNVGRLLTQRRLTREVWSDKRDDEALQLLRTTIGFLRQKLELNPSRPRLITTEPGVGFRMRAGP